MDHRRMSAVWVLLLAGFGVVAAFAQQAAWKTPPAMLHPAEGRDNCLMCHEAGKMEPVPDAPASHAEYPNDICLACHAPDAAVQTTAPTAIAHSLEGRTACLMCHEPGKMEPVPDAPADHAGRQDTFCSLCHKPAG